MDRLAYRKMYRLRPYGKGGYEITVPGIILDRAARSRGLTIEEFVRTHKVVHLFNNFTSFDAAYRFEPDRDANQEVLEISEEELRELAPQEKPVQSETITDRIARLRKSIERQV